MNTNHLEDTVLDTIKAKVMAGAKEIEDATGDVTWIQIEALADEHRGELELETVLEHLLAE